MSQIAAASAQFYQRPNIKMTLLTWRATKDLQKKNTEGEAALTLCLQPGHITPGLPLKLVQMSSSVLEFSPTTPGKVSLCVSILLKCDPWLTEFLPAHSSSSRCFWSCSCEWKTRGTRLRRRSTVIDECCDGCSASLNRERG